MRKSQHFCLFTLSPANFSVPLSCIPCVGFLFICWFGFFFFLGIIYFLCFSFWSVFGFYCLIIRVGIEYGRLLHSLSFFIVNFFPLFPMKSNLEFQSTYGTVVLLSCYFIMSQGMVSYISCYDFSVLDGSLLNCTSASLCF